MKKKAAEPPHVLILGTINEKPIRLIIDTKKVSVGTCHADNLWELLSKHKDDTNSTIVLSNERPVVQAMISDRVKLSAVPYVKVKCPKRFMRILKHEAITRMPTGSGQGQELHRSFLQDIINDTQQFLGFTGG